MSDLTKQFQNAGLSKKELEKLILNKDWQTIFEYKVDFQHFVDFYAHKIDWDDLSATARLSEDFIKANYEKVNWKYISQNQILSENFMREHYKYLHWNEISRYQFMSEEFITEFITNINREQLIENPKACQSFIRKIKNDQEKIKYYIAFVMVFLLLLSIFCYLFYYKPINKPIKKIPLNSFTHSSTYQEVEEAMGEKPTKVDKYSDITSYEWHGCEVRFEDDRIMDYWGDPCNSLEYDSISGTWNHQESWSKYR
jgi:hypothetical protein